MGNRVVLAKKTNEIFAHPSWSLIAGFGVYFCMYGFRKPYTAATYEGVFFRGLDYKFLLIIAQTAGYVISKWMGIKIVSEIKRQQRVTVLLRVLLLAELMLLLFAVIPRPWNISCLFFNGLFLGIVFGLVLGFLEGRKNTEALVAGLCASFIVSDGVSKSVGRILLDMHLAEVWMPFVAGLVFFVPVLLFAWMLKKVPAPSASDIESRSERAPMHVRERWDFFIKYFPGITGIVIVYLFATLLRSIRADFAPELWFGLGYRQTPALFTQSELLVSFGVVIMNGMAVFIMNHYSAFRISLFTCLTGFILLLVAVAGLNQGMDKFWFMVLAGLGIYLPYVAVHTTLFERLIAATKEKANIGFLMYIADAVGYSGYIVLMLFRYITPAGTSVLLLFVKICTCLSVAGIFIVLILNTYFKMKLRNNEPNITSLSTGQGSHI